MGDNANLKLSENHINARTVMIVDRLTIDASHVDQGEANGLYGTYRMLCCSLI